MELPVLVIMCPVAFTATGHFLFRAWWVTAKGQTFVEGDGALSRRSTIPVPKSGIRQYSDSFLERFSRTCTLASTGSFCFDRHTVGDYVTSR